MRCGGGNSMNPPNQQAVELFLQESSEHLQYLREYSDSLQEFQANPEDSSKNYTFPRTHPPVRPAATASPQFFQEAAAKMAHIFLIMR